MATGGVAGVVFVVVGFSVDSIGVVGRERREGGASSSSMVVVWGGGRGEVRWRHRRRWL